MYLIILAYYIIVITLATLYTEWDRPRLQTSMIQSRLSRLEQMVNQYERNLLQFVNLKKQRWGLFEETMNPQAQFTTFVTNTTAKVSCLVV